MTRARREALMPRFKGQLLKSKPHGFDSVQMTEEERIFFESQALEIFTECSNSGLPFRSSLMAILISGMDWGVNGLKDRREAS